jgi:hypothetical protein
MNTKVGTILGISGHPMSGLWTLHLDSGSALIESGYGVRILAACFGATEGTGDLLDKIRGKKIAYRVDAFGVLEGFTPYDEFLEVLKEHGLSEEDLEKT